MITSPALSHTATSAPIPGTPSVPQEILDLTAKPLLRGEYKGTERESWFKGVPLLSKKLTSTRDVTFSNDFNILQTDGPMVAYAASSLDDAVRAARHLAFQWSDPSIGGQIYSSVGVAVLQASDGAYFMAMIGSGNPHTSSSALGYRSDKFDDNILGNIKRSNDAKTASAWSSPVDSKGKPVNVAPPAADRKIVERHVKNVKIDKLVPTTPMLKAVVDINELYKIG